MMDLATVDVSEDFDWCYGVTSEVLKDQHGRDLHLLMLDLDDITESYARKIVNNQLPDGVYVLQRSSENCFNVISLNVMPYSRVIETKAQVNADDAQHFKIGVQRNKWVTRLGAKGVKDAPEFVDVICVGDWNDKVYSLDHTELFTLLFDCRSIMPAFRNTLSEGIERIKYPTRAERGETE